MAHHHEGADEVHFHFPADTGDIAHEQGLHDSSADGRHQNVQPSGEAMGKRQDSLDLIFPAGIAGEHLYPRSRALRDQFRMCPGQGFPATAHDDHRCAIVCQSTGTGQADPGACSRDQRRPARQSRVFHPRFSRQWIFTK